MDTAISHKEMRMDNGSDFLVDGFIDVCVPVLIDAIAALSLLFVSDGCASGTCSALLSILITSGARLQ
ncbi:MAG TPA: hypothetical protein VEL69_06815 [Ktedonobacteraceae bacterium]|nr:hypothetical protein [Ktedonobacteraceae bacterium]